MPELMLWAQLYLYPLLGTLGLWGLLTGGLLWLNRQGAPVARLALLLSMGGLALAHQRLWVSRHDLSIWGCYEAFAASMGIWTWHELAFYSGLFTGPWLANCPPTARGWQRFVYALLTHLYHEIAVFIDLLLLWRLTQDATNHIGLITFSLLWALQHSAKLNVFFGVRNLQVSLLPNHLRYLGSFWAQRPANAFFLPAIIIPALLSFWFWQQASILNLNEGAIGMALLASLTTFGVFEHLLLVVPAGKSYSQVEPES